MSDPSAPLVLKDLEGYTRVVEDSVERILERYVDNPRAGALMEHAQRTLRGQVPTLRARVQSIDFLAPSVRLVVEVDGGYHASRSAADRRRDAQLARLGYRTLRIEADLIRRALPAALDRIRVALPPSV